MRYIILIYSNPESRALWASFSEAERGEGLRAYAELVDELTTSGELVVTEALGDPSLSKRIALRDGNVTTDGPFPEVKELLAGFFLVECETEERAVEIAGRLPEATLGLIELRPVMRYDMPEL